MELESKTIRLRTLKLSDLSVLYKWHQNKEIRMNAMVHPYPVSLESEESWLKNILEDKSNSKIYFGISEKESTAIVGYTSLIMIDWISRNCKYGIIIGNKSNRNKGYGQLATKMTIDYAFSNLNLNKVSLEVLKNNNIALHIYEKLGFIREGELKNHFYWEDHFHDVVIMSIFRDSF
ncbi:MAG: GNAT family N-acetyltransferase [Bacteroidales bacterium]|nr:GNAT family N-acetyltransferase [Bacteroidales bacterium]